DRGSRVAKAATDAPEALGIVARVGPRTTALRAGAGDALLPAVRSARGRIPLNIRGGAEIETRPPVRVALEADARVGSRRAARRREAVRGMGGIVRLVRID